VGRLVAPEEFWIELRAGASVATASQASGVSYFTGYRWLAEAGGPDVNRPGSDGGSDSRKDEDHASTEEVPAGVAGQGDAAGA
jgi:transposase